MFDVAKGVLIVARRCTLGEALDELVRVAKQYQVGVLALARALVAVATAEVDSQCDQRAAHAATAEWGNLLSAF